MLSSCFCFPLAARDRGAYWSDLYGRHLDKWLHQERFTQEKTVVRYERLKTNIGEEFSKLCGHFEWPLDLDRVNAVSAQVTKERVKETTSHDPQATNLTRNYAEGRQRFHKDQGDFVWEVLLDDRQYLGQYFWG